MIILQLQLQFIQLYYCYIIILQLYDYITVIQLYYSYTIILQLYNYITVIINYI